MRVIALGSAHGCQHCPHWRMEEVNSLGEEKMRLTLIYWQRCQDQPKQQSSEVLERFGEVPSL